MKRYGQNYTQVIASDSADDSIRHIPYQYRGREVMQRTLELEMAEMAARLIPCYVLKV